MIKTKSKRTKGKLSLTKYFQKFNEGDRVSIVRELSENPKFPARIQGLTGVVKGMRGKAYLLEVNEGKSKKTHIIKPVHLKKLK